MSRPTPPTYKTRNWPTYNKALKRRGSLTIWFDPAMTWEAVPTGKRGRQPDYSDAAIQTCLTMKVLFGMALRQMAAFVAGASQSRMTREGPGRGGESFSSFGQGSPARGLLRCATATFLPQGGERRGLGRAPRLDPPGPPAQDAGQGPDLRACPQRPCAEDP